MKARTQHAAARPQLQRRLGRSKIQSPHKASTSIPSNDPPISQTLPSKPSWSSPRLPLAMELQHCLGRLADPQRGGLKAHGSHQGDLKRGELNAGSDRRGSSLARVFRPFRRPFSRPRDRCFGGRRGRQAATQAPWFFRAAYCRFWGLSAQHLGERDPGYMQSYDEKENLNVTCWR